jgi:hypothetical protein
VWQLARFAEYRLSVVAKRTTARAAIDWDELLRRARQELEQTAAIRVSTLAPAAARAELAQRLASEGFEVTKSLVRIPLKRQLASALADGAAIAVSTAHAHVEGATRAEVRKTIAELTRAGEARLVLRGKVVTLVSASARVVSPGALLHLQRTLANLAKQVGTVLKAKQPTSLLVSDVTAFLQELQPGLSVEAGAPKNELESKAPGDVLERVFSAVDAALDERIGLSFVPRIVQLLQSELGGVDAVRSALAGAAELGLLELRPEGGMNRLSPAELELCLPGPQGTRLSWARRRDEAKA